MSLEETAKQRLAALHVKLEGEFDALVQKLEGLFGRNNQITPHVQATKESVLGHLVAHAFQQVDAAAAAPIEETPQPGALETANNNGAQQETKPLQEDAGNAGNGADGIAAQKEALAKDPATGAAPAGE